MSAPDDPIHIVLHGDSRELLKTLLDDSVDALVTDPPAGIAFMAKEWDDPEAWKYPISKHGFSDGGDRVPAPAIGSSSRNPNCRVCRRHKRGWKDTPGCECEHPEFDTLDSRLADRDAFIAFLRDIMAECFRTLKPGGHGIIWSIPRTSHWTATAIEEAGFEIRDCIYHVFGQGFPKSLNVGKAIDRQAGVEREVVGYQTLGGRAAQSCKEKGGTYSAGAPSSAGMTKDVALTEPATDDAKKWDGWGTSLKPAVECWWLVRKPVEAQNVASQVLKTGTGAINIRACRVTTEDNLNGGAYSEDVTERHDGTENWRYKRGEAGVYKPPAGRWPSNLVLSHSPGCVKTGTTTVKAPTINTFNDGMKPFGDGAGHPYTQTGGGTEEQPVYECAPGCPVAAMDRQSGSSVSVGGDSSGGSAFGQGSGWNEHENRVTEIVRQGDSGGASRFFKNFEPQYDVPFFYTGKASKRDKNADLDDMPDSPSYMVENGSKTSGLDGKRYDRNTVVKNTHPTVKSQDLMQYLVKLVTPPGGIVLDPFAGSGSTLVAAVTEGMQFIGIEREDEYVQIAQKRVDAVLKKAAEKNFGEDLFALAMSLGDEE